MSDRRKARKNPSNRVAKIDPSSACDTSRLHLGCGEVHIPGFFHMDIQPYPHIDHIGAVEKLDFITDDSVELIYACHVLEHFGRFQIVDVLREWRRVLQPGGVLRLAVPDFSACAAIYYEEGLKDGLSGLVGLVCGGQRDPTDFHRMIFDAPILSGLLFQAGFSGVRKWDWRATDHAQIDDYSQSHLPHMDKDNGRLMSLNLEAVK
jgi:SAM-dependent methyltransferase